MFFNPFPTPKSTIYASNSKPSWQVGWGNVDSLIDNVAFRDKNFAIIAADKGKIAISSGEDFVVIGDVWLSNQAELLGKLGIEASEFKGSECQIIAELWQKWGCDCLNLLLGMFAFVVCDRNTQKLWCVRDCVGARTLYYTTTGSLRWISPNMRSLSPYHHHGLNLLALQDYLCCAFVPGEQTLWEGIKEVRPGHILQFPEEKVNSYWQVQEDIKAANKPLAWHGEKPRS